MRKFVFPFFAAACLALPVSAQTLDRIKETKQLNLGYRADAAPLSFQQEDGNPAGYTPLICAHIGQAIANHLKMENLDASFIPVDATNRFEKVASGEIDLLCGAATITLGRREIVDFSDPVYVDGTTVLVHKGASGQFSDLAGKKLGVRKSTTTQDALNISLKDAGIDAQIVPFVDHNAGMAAMENKEIDAYFADQTILTRMLMSSPKSAEFLLSNELLTIEKQGLAMARGDADFRLLVDTALSDMFADGRMKKLFEDALPGAAPGVALKAMYLMSPTFR